MSLTWRDAIEMRLPRHHLLQPAPAGDLVRVVSDICGVHAQVGASAELMLGARVSRITRQEVRDAAWRGRTLVKTVGLRGRCTCCRRKRSRSGWRPTGCACPPRSAGCPGSG